MGLAARLELSSLSLATNDTLSAIKTFFDLYKDLLNREWTLEKDQYDFFSQDIKESIDDIFSQAPLDCTIAAIPKCFYNVERRGKKTKKNHGEITHIPGECSSRFEGKSFSEIWKNLEVQPGDLYWRAEGTHILFLC